MKIFIGRPEKNRNKSNNESRNKIILYKIVKFKKCVNLSHNTGTCKGKEAVYKVIPKSGNNILYVTFSISIVFYYQLLLYFALFYYVTKIKITWTSKKVINGPTKKKMMIDR